MVDPYDDPDVIAGQGTIGLEMLAAHPEIDCLCVAIGGGGLISGIAVAARSIKPDIRIIGVQTEHFPAMYAHFKGVELPSANATLAEGIAVKSPGNLTKPLVMALVDDIVLVPEADIEHAIVMMLEIEKTVVEGAGAAGLAALLRHPEKFRGRKVGLVLCGGNIDPMVLADIIERGMVRAGKAGADSGGDAGRAGGTGAGGDDRGQRRGEYRGGGAPAGVHDATGAERAAGDGAADARAGAYRGGVEGVARGGVGGGVGYLLRGRRHL